mgnify:CR=1 FL=1
MNVPSLKPLAIVAGIALALGACSQKPAETESATTPAAESAAATTAEPAHKRPGEIDQALRNSALLHYRTREDKQRNGKQHE